MQGLRHSLTVPPLTAGRAAQEAPSPASQQPQPEAAPSARPGHRRHLLGEALRAACGGHRGLLARPEQPREEPVGPRGLGTSLVW